MITLDEFVELYNADLIDQDLTGHRLSGDVDFEFPDGYILPAGGLAPDGSRWLPWRPRFFLPVRVLSRRFRPRYLAGLKSIGLNLRVAPNETFDGLTLTVLLPPPFDNA